MLCPLLNGKLVKSENDHDDDESKDASKVIRLFLKYLDYDTLCLI